VVCRAVPWVRGPPARSSDVRGQACSLVVAWRLVLGVASPKGAFRRMEGMRAGGPRTQAWASLSLALFQGGGERRGFVEAVPSVRVTQRPGPPRLPPPRVGVVREPPLQGKCAAPWVRGPPARSSGVRWQACSLVVAWRLILRVACPMGLSRRIEGMRAGGPRTQAWASLSLALFQSRGVRRGFVEAVPSVYVTQRPGPPWLPPPRVGAVREPPLQGPCLGTLPLASPLTLESTEQCCRCGS